MNELSPEILKLRYQFISTVRSFFSTNGFVEIDTPILRDNPGMEPYLDPYIVSSPVSGREGFLITSPEYSLKQALSMGLENIFEIAHCFRSGEKGQLHTREFLMLEFYEAKKTEQDLIETCRNLFLYLQNNFKDFGYVKERTQKHSVNSLFMRFTGRGYETEELIATLQEKMPAADYDYQNMYYEDLFFLVFLNYIEPELNLDVPVFVYDYPPELAALARVEDGKAKRFEIYWKGVELGNAFYELTSPGEQFIRFQKEQVKRKEIGKEVFPIDDSFMNALKRGIPECSGIAIGLDRLFMIIMEEPNLKFVSPYFRRFT